jgi:hypothetical protein
MQSYREKKEEKHTRIFFFGGMYERSKLLLAKVLGKCKKEEAGTENRKNEQHTFVFVGMYVQQVTACYGAWTE